MSETGPEVAPIPRLLLTRAEAAASLSMSIDHFERHIQPTVKLVIIGSKRYVSVSDLQEWIASRGAIALERAA